MVNKELEELNKQELELRKQGKQPSAKHVAERKRINKEIHEK